LARDVFGLRIKAKEKPLALIPNMMYKLTVNTPNSLGSESMKG